MAYPICIYVILHLIISSLCRSPSLSLVALSLEMSPTSVPAFTDPSLPLPVIPVLSSHIDLVFTPPIILSSQEELVFIPAAPPTTVKLIPQPAHRKSTLQPAHHPVPESSSTDNNMSDGASLESSLTSIESGTIKISKPEGEAGRPGRGGYNLKAQLAWNPATFLKLKVQSTNEWMTLHWHAYCRSLSIVLWKITLMQHSANLIRENRLYCWWYRR